MKTILRVAPKKERLPLSEIKSMSPVTSDVLTKEELKKREIEIWKPPERKETLEQPIITKEKPQDEKEKIEEKKDFEELREDLLPPKQLEETKREN